jgi:hypothetical protein
MSPSRSHSDPPGDLLAHDGVLALSVGAGEQDARLGARWPDDDPSLRATVVGQRR